LLCSALPDWPDPFAIASPRTPGVWGQFRNRLIDDFRETLTLVGTTTRTANSHFILLEKAEARTGREHLLAPNSGFA
jgi:hypothetical protein